LCFVAKHKNNAEHIFSHQPKNRALIVGRLKNKACIFLPARKVWLYFVISQKNGQPEK